MEWNVKTEPCQEGFLVSRARFPAFVAGWGVGKTMIAIGKGMASSIKYAGNLGLIVRKSFTDLKDSTMSDFTKYTGIKVGTNKDVVLSNGSKIMFRHLDELAGITQNVNLGWFFIEQAEEFDSDTEFELLGGRLRRNGCFRQGFVVANTNGHNWIWRKWKNKGGAEYMCDKPFNPPTGLDGVEYSGFAELFEARTADNAKNLPVDFLASLEIKKDTAPGSYNRFVMNSWDEADVSDRCIPYGDLRAAIGRDLRDYDNNLTVLSCDPAEFGDDKTAIYVLKGLKVVAQKFLAKKEPMETAGHLIAMMREYNADVIALDDLMVGSGIASRLREILKTDEHNPVMTIRVSKSALDPARYHRLRDQLWMHASELFREGYVSIPDDDILIEDLSAFTYSMNSKGQVMVAHKKDVKKLLQRSPDRADALVMGLWAAKKGKARQELATIGAGVDDADYDVLRWGL